MSNDSRSVTIPGRLSYAHLFKPHAPNEQAAPKYSATILIPKTDTATLQAVQAAIDAAVHDGIGRQVFKNAIDPAQTKYPPLRDGDTPNDSGEARGAEFAGHYFIAAKSPASRKPHVVDARVQPIIDESEIYSGCYCNFAIQFYAYSNSGNKGISASLVGVQKVKDGERLGGAPVTAGDVFSAITPAAGSGQQGGSPWDTQPTNGGGLGF